jgi:hypothetical protein
MPCKHLTMGAAALTLNVAVVSGTAILFPALAAVQDYRFELVGKPQAARGGKSTVSVRVVQVPDNKPLKDAVIFESKADMSPMAMPTMTAPIKPVPPARDGIYRFEVEPGMAGTWAITLAAKVQGEAETVRGTVTADLVK